MMALGGRQSLWEVVRSWIGFGTKARASSFILSVWGHCGKAPLNESKGRLLQTLSLPTTRILDLPVSKYEEETSIVYRHMRILPWEDIETVWSGSAYPVPFLWKQYALHCGHPFRWGPKSWAQAQVSWIRPSRFRAKLLLSCSQTRNKGVFLWLCRWRKLNFSLIHAKYIIYHWGTPFWAPKWVFNKATTIFI